MSLFREISEMKTCSSVNSPYYISRYKTKIHTVGQMIIKVSESRILLKLMSAHTPIIKSLNIDLTPNISLIGLMSWLKKEC